MSFVFDDELICEVAKLGSNKNDSVNTMICAARINLILLVIVVVLNDVTEEIAGKDRINAKVRSFNLKNYFLNRFYHNNLF